MEIRKVSKKRILIILLPFLYLTILPFIARAATITICAFDRNVYNQGETGYITVSIYNDKDDKIRVTELTTTVDYYYTGGNVYLQTFYTDETLPIEIQLGQTGAFNIPFSLPTNIAPGYTDVLVKAKTELWNNNSGTWIGSEHPTSRPVLYIESPYKQLFEGEQEANEEFQHQVQELQALNATTTSIIYVLGLMTAIFGVITVILIVLNRKSRALTQPAI